MSTWVGIELDGMTVLEQQNHLPKWYFRKSERIQIPPPEDDQDSGPSYLYKAPAKVIARRLAFDGYDLEYLKQDFKKQLAQMVQDCRDMFELRPEGKCVELLPILERSTLQDWLDRLRRIRNEGLKSNYWDDVKPDYGDLLLNFMLGNQEDYYFSDYPGGGGFSFPCTTQEMYAVALLQVVPEDSYFVLDATHLISAGWTDDFEDFIEFHQEHTAFYNIFRIALDDILRLVDLAPSDNALQRLLFANVISAMETYLSDTFRKQVLKRDAILRRFVKIHDDFKNGKKEPVSEIFSTYDRINEIVNKAIDVLSFHNIVTAKKLYKEVLSTAFPESVSELMRAVEIRHHIVHRNGKDLDSNEIVISSDEVKALAQLVDDAVKFIDGQVKDGLLDDDETDDRA